MPFAVGKNGKVVTYLACGPAGRPAGTHLVAAMDVGHRRIRARIHVLTEPDRSGQLVYSRPNHTMN